MLTTEVYDACAQGHFPTVMQIWDMPLRYRSDSLNEFACVTDKYNLCIASYADGLRLVVTSGSKACIWKISERCYHAELQRLLMVALHAESADKMLALLKDWRDARAQHRSYTLQHGLRLGQAAKSGLEAYQAVKEAVDAEARRLTVG